MSLIDDFGDKGKELQDKLTGAKGKLSDLSKNLDIEEAVPGLGDVLDKAGISGAQGGGKPNTPPVGCEGSWVIREPYNVDPGIMYRCAAVRKHYEMLDSFIPIYELYYLFKGVSREDYAKDKAVDASMVTLVDPDDNYINVPDTYIESYPSMGPIKYSRKVLIVELGMLPDHIDVKHLYPNIQDLVTKTVGVDCTPTVAVVPHSGEISHEEHVQLENARRAKVQSNKTILDNLMDLEFKAAGQQLMSDATAAVITGEMPDYLPTFPTMPDMPDIPGFGGGDDEDDGSGGGWFDWAPDLGFGDDEEEGLESGAGEDLPIYGGNMTSEDKKDARDMLTRLGIDPTTGERTDGREF